MMKHTVAAGPHAPSMLIVYVLAQAGPRSQRNLCAMTTAAARGPAEDDQEPAGQIIRAEETLHRW